MEHYVLYCKSCHALTSAALKAAEETGLCPKCGAILVPTGITHKEWNAMPQEELARVRDLLDTAAGTNAVLVKLVRDDLAAQHLNQIQSILVTTGDLKEGYEIIGPVCAQVTNKAPVNNYGALVKKYLPSAEALRELARTSPNAWAIRAGLTCSAGNDFDRAVFAGTQDLRDRARLLGADAVICMRQNMTVDTDTYTAFFLNMYGTAVRRIKPDHLK